MRFSFLMRLEKLSVQLVHGSMMTLRHQPAFQGTSGCIPETDEIKIYFNSNGGSVDQGTAIYNMLQQHGSYKTGIVMGRMSFYRIYNFAGSVISVSWDREQQPLFMICGRQLQEMQQI